MDKPFFLEQIKKLTIEYSDFRMSKEKADQWFDYLKHIDNIMFEVIVDGHIKNNRSYPAMCDLYMQKINFYEGEN